MFWACRPPGPPHLLPKSIDMYRQMDFEPIPEIWTLILQDPQQDPPHPPKQKKARSLQQKQNKGQRLLHLWGIPRKGACHLHPEAAPATDLPQRGGLGRRQREEAEGWLERFTVQGWAGTINYHLVHAVRRNIDFSYGFTCSTVRRFGWAVKAWVDGLQEPYFNPVALPTRQQSTGKRHQWNHSCLIPERIPESIDSKNRSLKGSVPGLLSTRDVTQSRGISVFTTLQKHIKRHGNSLYMFAVANLHASRHVLFSAFFWHALGLCDGEVLALLTVYKYS